MHIKYLAYNIIKTDFRELHNLVKKLSAERGLSITDIYKDIAVCLFKYNTKLLDYFYLGLFNEDTRRPDFTDVWHLHQFHQKFNTKDCSVFQDKVKFRARFKNYFTYPYRVVTSEKNIDDLLLWAGKNQFYKIVTKIPLGNSGKQVKVLDLTFAGNEVTVDGIDAHKALLKLYKEGYILFESFVDQHPVLKNINPISVNTIRIVTFVNDQAFVEVWVAIIRFGWNTPIDNFSNGGLSSNINLETGEIDNLAKVRDPFTKERYANHPVTGNAITGVKVPFWKETIEMVKKAALEVPGVRTVGWDIAMTPTGPTLIEGNDNWGIYEAISEEPVGNRIRGLL
ncbi:sugar-transfer associated ATP-grasp domain-containing protein [Emticicia fluvialis]|uniref:sugar-transfer associated ATP-grasp domain-containing protein n=1 Tax=Emticicia fluvialis TaxID=2974474 RepID=UPI00216510E8|nr:sugar-transfer associated ATP-grasp domain-containing protein [Emticicia fluvialis]